MTEEERSRGAQDLLRAEVERKADPAAKPDISEHGDRGRLPHPGSVGGSTDCEGRPDGWPQDRPDFAGDADGLENDGAGLRPHPRRRPLQTTGRRSAPLASSSRGSKSNWPSSWAKIWRGRAARIYDVMRATEFVVPALEIIDYRTEVPRAITDTIADNAAFGAIVVGGRTIRPMDIDIRWVGATLVEERRHRGIRRFRGDHGPSGRRHRLARQQAPRGRSQAEEGPDRSGRVVHPPRRHRRGRCDPGRLRAARRHRRFVRFEIRRGYAAEKAFQGSAHSCSPRPNPRSTVAKIVRPGLVSAILRRHCMPQETLLPRTF